MQPSTLVVHEGEIRFVARAALGLFTPDLAPKERIDRGKARVAFGLERDLGDGEAVGAPDGLGVDFPAARDHDRVRPHSVGALGGQLERGLERVRNERAGGREGHVAGDDDGLASGQRPADRFEGLPPHDQRFAYRQRLEALEVA